MSATDRAIMQKIYDRYHRKFSRKNTEYYLVIDLESICDELGLDYGIVWGRFYYYNQVYGFPEKKIEFFGVDGKINFPLMVSVLEMEKEKYMRFTLPLYLSVSLSIISLIISLVK